MDIKDALSFSLGGMTSMGMIIAACYHRWDWMVELAVITLIFVGPPIKAMWDQQKGGKK